MQYEHEAPFRRLIESSSQGMAVIRDGHLLFANQAFAEIWGYATVDDLLRIESCWMLVAPHDRARLRLHYEDCMARPAAVLQASWQGVHRQGHPLCVEHKACAVTWQGEPAMQLTVLDRTAYNQAEQTLRGVRQRLWDLAARLQERQENERRYIAREIHDELAQGLTGLKLDVYWLRSHLSDAAGKQDERLHAMGRQLDRLMTAVRRIGTALRPEILDDLGLAAAIEWQLQEVCQRAHLSSHLTLSPNDLEVEPEQATALFRIFQEALTNVVRHAEAHTVEVRLSRHGAVLCLDVHDDGKGIAADRLADRTALGLLSMRERAQLWGGEARIAGNARTGTTVTVRLPLPQGVLQGMAS